MIQEAPITGFHKALVGSPIKEGSYATERDLLNYAISTLDRVLIYYTLGFENYLEQRNQIAPMNWGSVWNRTGDPSYQFFLVLDHISQQTGNLPLEFDHLADAGKFVVPSKVATYFYRNIKYGQQRIATSESIKSFIDHIGAGSYSTEPKEAVAELILTRFALKVMIDNGIKEPEIRSFLGELTELSKDEAIAGIADRLNTELQKQNTQ